LGYDVFNLPPRRDPFAPGNEGDAAERSANQDNNEPAHGISILF
jgi:hypothetical protein